MFGLPERPRAQLLSPGQRITITGRKGTFLNYLLSSDREGNDTLPNFIQWLPDGHMQIETAIWSAGGCLVSEWDESSKLSVWDFWEYQLKENNEAF